MSTDCSFLTISSRCPSDSLYWYLPLSHFYKYEIFGYQNVLFFLYCINHTTIRFTICILFLLDERHTTALHPKTRWWDILGFLPKHTSNEIVLSSADVSDVPLPKNSHLLHGEPACYEPFQWVFFTLQLSATPFC